MNGPVSDVFISYKAEDRKRLTPLVKALEDEGFDVWWDQHIGSGTNWRDEIETHLDAAKVVIVVWSKKTIGPEGRFVRDEAGQAQEAGHYLPITVDNVRPPLGFREVQALDLSSWKGSRADPRFKVLTDTIRHRLAGKEIGRKALVIGKAPVSRRGVMIGGGAATAAVAAGVVGWEFLMPRAANAKRIAVLPFDNLSGDEGQAYFSDGVAEELRAALSRVGLQVIGRASSTAVKDLDTRAAAAKLGVANVLTGSVRRSPEMIRVNAQLLSGSDGVEHWTQSYDRPPGDAIKIQTDIATNVADALSVALGHTAKTALALGGTGDAVAQDLFLRAINVSNTVSGKEGAHNAMALLDAAIARDPNYANAWRVKAMTLERMATTGMADPGPTLMQADAAAKRAVTIAPKLGPAYLPIAWIAADRLDFPVAVSNMDRALALAPDNIGVISHASTFMQAFGDGRKALGLADRALALDPLQGISHSRKASVLWALRDYSASIAEARKALELAPQLSAAQIKIADCLMMMNRNAEAKAEYEKAPADDIFRLTGQAILATRSHDNVAADRTIGHVRDLFGASATYQYAQFFAQGGDANRAFAELENAVRVKDPGLQGLKSDPFLDPIVRDPRYGALLKKLNFPSWA